MKEEKSDIGSSSLDLMRESNIDKEEEGLVDKKTLKKYRVHWYNRIPYPVKSLFIKYWFFGLVYFLFMNGLGSLEIFRSETLFSVMTLVLILITGLAIGVFNDLLVYNILDVLEDYPGQKEDYVFFKSRKLYSIFINAVYGLVIGFCGIYLSGTLASLVDPSLSSLWFREPFTCGLVLFFVDFVFLLLKYLFVHKIFRKRD